MCRQLQIQIFFNEIYIHTRQLITTSQNNICLKKLIDFSGRPFEKLWRG